MNNILITKNNKNISTISNISNSSGESELSSDEESVTNNIIKRQIEEDLTNYDFSEPHFKRESIESILNMKIKNLNHYLRALVHKSIYKAVKRYSSPKPIQEYLRQHNERLEFLGDSVLGFIVANYLFHKYPDNDEGFLTKLKTKIVNSAQLASMARKINLGELILMSTHVKNIGGKTNQRILEDSFEALLAAIFKDLGFDAANHFLIQLIETLDFDELLIEDNYKDILLRYSQNKGLNAMYSVVSTEGPPHNREFIISVIIDSKEYSTGRAKSKKKAEQIAAMNTLKKLNVIK
jgi:ribonuclease-3